MADERNPIAKVPSYVEEIKRQLAQKNRTVNATPTGPGVTKKPKNRRSPQSKKREAQ